MRRRHFIGALGGFAFVRPAIGQTRNIPLIGFLNAASPDTYRFNADSFGKDCGRPASSKARTSGSKSAGLMGTTARYHASPPILFQGASLR